VTEASGTLMSLRFNAASSPNRNEQNAARVQQARSVLPLLCVAAEDELVVCDAPHPVALPQLERDLHTVDEVEGGGLARPETVEGVARKSHRRSVTDEANHWAVECAVHEVRGDRGLGHDPDNGASGCSVAPAIGAGGRARGELCNNARFAQWPGPGSGCPAK
jgi:hypothetical protein